MHSMASVCSGLIPVVRIQHLGFEHPAMNFAAPVRIAARRRWVKLTTEAAISPAWPPSALALRSGHTRSAANTAFDSTAAAQ